MSNHEFRQDGLQPSRREMLLRCGTGIGALALAQLFGEAEGSEPSLEPRRPLFAPKARRMIHIFANGGPSQVDTFDPKPLLKKYHGKPIPRELIPEARDAQASGSPAFASPYKFQPRGQSGI